MLLKMNQDLLYVIKLCMYWIFCMNNILMNYLSSSLLSMHILSGFPDVPGGHMQTNSSWEGTQLAPMPHLAQGSEHLPLMHDFPMGHSLSFIHPSRWQTPFEDRTNPDKHVHCGLCFWATHILSEEQTIWSHGSEQILSKQASAEEQSELYSHDGTREQPLSGSPVVPGGHIQVAECWTVLHCAETGHGFVAGRHGLTHCPLKHSSSSGHWLLLEHPTCILYWSR